MSLPSTVGDVTCRQEGEHGEHGRQQQQREQRLPLSIYLTFSPVTEQVLIGVCDHHKWMHHVTSINVVMCRQEAEHGQHGRQQQQREQRLPLFRKPTVVLDIKQLLSAVGVITCRQAAEHGQHGRQQQQREQRRSKRPVVNPNSKQAELLASVAADMNTFSNDGSFMDSFAALQAAGGAHGQTGRPMPTEEEEELSLSGVVVRLACTHIPWHSVTHHLYRACCCISKLAASLDASHEQTVYKPTCVNCCVCLQYCKPLTQVMRPLFLNLCALSLGVGHASLLCVVALLQQM